MRLKILKYAYQHYTEHGTLTCCIPFNQIEASLLDINNTFKNLESDGYIEIPSRAIGEAYIRLTDRGLSFCEQNFEV